jgi:putative two-component system response regulator
MADKMKILIVEDDTPLAMMMVSLLTRADCETEVATTGKKAMQFVEERNFDLITLDVDLPDTSGFEICGELKQRHHSRHIPIVFISGRACERDRQRGLELGAVDYITKPFAAMDFGSRILSHVKFRQAKKAHVC